MGTAVITIIIIIVVDIIFIMIIEELLWLPILRDTPQPTADFSIINTPQNLFK